MYIYLYICMYVCICKYRQYTYIYVLYISIMYVFKMEGCQNPVAVGAKNLFMFEEKPIILICHCYGV